MPVLRRVTLPGGKTAVGSAGCFAGCCAVAAVWAAWGPGAESLAAQQHMV